MVSADDLFSQSPTETSTDTDDSIIWIAVGAALGLALLVGVASVAATALCMRKVHTCRAQGAHKAE